MIDWLTSLVQICALALAAWTFVDAFRDRPMSRAHLFGMAVLEVLLIVQAIVSIVKLTGLPGSADTVMFVGYLATVVLAIPVAAIWGVTDRSRWGPVVAGGAALTVAAVMMRMDQIWQLLHG